MSRSPIDRDFLLQKNKTASNRPEENRSLSIQRFGVRFDGPMAAADEAVFSLTCRF